MILSQKAPGGCDRMEKIELGEELPVIRKKRKAFVDEDSCVACGCCVKVCPLGIIEIYRGIMAQIDRERCVGCGRCAGECPASVIELREVEG